MKYYAREVNETQWEYIYCNNNKNTRETSEEIMHAVAPGLAIERFNKDDYEPLDNTIKNCENMFISTDTDNSRTIWQVSLFDVTDMHGISIPNLYKVRQVGSLLEI